MKITPEHLAELEKAMAQWLDLKNLTWAGMYDHYEKHQIGKDTRMRARWDCVWGAKQREFITHDWFKKAYALG